MNQLFRQLNQAKPGTGNDFLSRFNRFWHSFSGDPQQMIQQMMNSGRISQAQYNSAVQETQQLAKVLGMKL